MHPPLRRARDPGASDRSPVRLPMATRDLTPSHGAGVRSHVRRGALREDHRLRGGCIKIRNDQTSPPPDGHACQARRREGCADISRGGPAADGRYAARAASARHPGSAAPTTSCGTTSARRTMGERCRGRSSGGGMSNAWRSWRPSWPRRPAHSQRDRMRKRGAPLLGWPRSWQHPRPQPPDALREIGREPER